MQKSSKTNQSSFMDLSDSERDKKELEPETVFIDLPDVKDIPGQENVKPAPMGELRDTTVSSADEEGDNIFNDDDLEEDLEDSDADVTDEEKEDLRRSASDMPTDDDINLRRTALDNTDDDGVPLNEGSFKKNVTAADLDIPGADDDDENEEIGEEDEENNEYSLGGDNHDS